MAQSRLEAGGGQGQRPAAISALRHEVSGLVAITPEGGKVERAQAVSPQVESCNIHLAHSAIAPWVESFIEECSSFANGRYDDQVDHRRPQLGIVPDFLGTATYQD